MCVRRHSQTETLHSEAASDQQLWEPLLVAPIVGAPEIVIPGTYSVLYPSDPLAEDRSRYDSLRFEDQWTAGAVACLRFDHGLTR